VNLLLDSCALIWLTSEPSQLSEAAVRAINQPEAVLHVSHASLWELSLKHAAGKLSLPESPRLWWSGQVNKWGLVELPLTAEALFRGTELPQHHKDPFDRVILAQADMLGLHLVSPDTEFPAYRIPLIW
jgi:PIN domain nuclease of toxin-antitoxin system